MNIRPLTRPPSPPLTCAPPARPAPEREPVDRVTLGSIPQAVVRALKASGKPALGAVGALGTYVLGTWLGPVGVGLGVAVLALDRARLTPAAGTGAMLVLGGLGLATTTDLLGPMLCVGVGALMTVQFALQPTCNPFSL